MKIRIIAIALIFVAVPLFVATQAQAQIFPQITISPDPLDFGDVRVGSTSTAMTLTATAAGGSLPTYIFGTRISDSSNFSIQSDGCSGATLQAGQSCTVDLTFSPQAMGHYSTSFVMISISQTIISSSLVEGRGVEPRVTLSTTSIDFGDQTVNKSSAEHEVLLTNSGNTSLSITSIVASDNFAVTDDCGDSVAPETGCTLGVTFTPPSADTFTGSVTITDDASNSPQTIALSGRGIAPGQPDASLSRHSVDFGGQLVGTTSGPERVTLTNTGTVALTINAITPSANFAVTDDCGATLAADASCNLDITFSPDQEGAFSGTVTIDDDASDSPQTISLTGQGVVNSGPAASLSTNSIDFGQQSINTTSQPQTVTLTNSGNEDLSIEDVTLGGENPEAFDGTDDCEGNVLKPSESCNGSVQFSPTEKSIYTAVITITDNASDSPQTINLTGTGVRTSGGNCSLADGNSALGIAPFAFILIGLLAMRRKKG